MRVLEEKKNANALQDFYVEQFKRRYGAPPILEHSDHEIFLWAAQKMPHTTAKSLLESYFSMDDEWIVKHAHAPFLFKKNINQVVAFLNAKTRGSRNLYLVAFTVTGRPVLSHGQYELLFISEGVPNPFGPGILISKH